MLHRLAASAVVVLVIAFASSGFSQDVKKDVKKETKPAVVEQAKKDVKPAAAASAKKDVKKPTKPATLKSISCSQPGCGLWAKSHSAKELKYFMKRHAKKYHKIDLTKDQLKAMVKVEGSK